MKLMGVTATWTSRQSGVHPRTLTEYLSGRVSILPHHAVKLARVLECPVEHLIDY